MLTVFDCLTVFEETFLVGETSQGTVNLHPDVWGMKDEYTLCDGEEWKETSGWWYRWYDSGREYLTENEYCGSFETAKKAIDDAYNYFGPQDDQEPEQDNAWKRFAAQYGCVINEEAC
jgi:hypothetical protein